MRSAGLWWVDARTRVRAILPAAIAVLAAGCSPRFVPTSHGAPVLEPPPVPIARVSLKYSNLYLLRGDSVALVDAGSPSDIEDLGSALAKVGLRPADVKVVVLTHGHGDHAGMALFLQRSGAKIVVGRGDELQTSVGHNDEMTPQSLFARVLKPVVKLPYDAFQPDVLVDDEADLAAYGLPGVRVKHMPGHTRGSLVVFVGRREAIVGDMMLGGIWGGMFHGETAGDHYYQLDPDQNRCNVQALLDAGIETYHLGHGGPVTRDAVLRWTESWGDITCAHHDGRVPGQ